MESNTLICKTFVNCQTFTFLFGDKKEKSRKHWYCVEKYSQL